jgi:hypothetical protein
MTFEKELDELINRHAVEANRSIHFLLAVCVHQCIGRLTDLIAYGEACREHDKIITFTDPARKFGEDITLGVVNGDGFIMGDKARLLLEAWHKEEHSKQNQAGSLEQRVETLRRAVDKAETSTETPLERGFRNALQYALAIMEGA